MPSIIVLFLSLIALLHAQTVEIPQKFFGAFQLDHSDNWDAYLAAKGYDAATRQNVKMPKLTRILYPREQGRYRMLIGTGVVGSKWEEGSSKHADWQFQLGREFRGKYWDGNEHLILFTYNPNTDRLTERHKIVGSQAPAEEFVYAINPEGNLDSHIFFKGVELVHHYIRTD